MKPFSAIAIPHRDILEGRLTMDVFAANLWDVYKGRAHEDYRDTSIFFRKTYTTEGLKNLLDIAEKRLRGEGGDPIIQLQTPFGGGKMDETLEYAITASGIKVEDSTCASQVLTFMRRLTDTVRTLDKTIMIHTYPSRSHYGEDDQKLLNQLLE
jgi:hypothetical protein